MRRLSWLRRRRKSEPEVPLRLPIAAAAVRDPRRRRLLEELVFARAEEGARRHGVDRREFLVSSCGMATTLFAINLLNGCARSDRAGAAQASDTSRGPMARGGPDAGARVTPPSTSRPDVPGPTDPRVFFGSDAGAPEVPATSSVIDGGAPDGGFFMPEAACEDEALADLLLRIGQPGADGLIIDMQTHIATPETGPLGATGFRGMHLDPISEERYPWMRFSPGVVAGGRYDRFEFEQQVLLGSPTNIAVLTGVAYRLGIDGTGGYGYTALINEDLEGTVAYLDSRYPGRVLGHPLVMPNDRIEVQLANMERYAAWCHGFRTDPSFAGDTGAGYRLDQGVGPRMLQKGIDLGRPIFSIVKGATPIGSNPDFSTLEDIGPAARMFPNAHLIVSQAGFEQGFASPRGSSPSDMPNYTECGSLQLGPGPWPEGPYDESDPQLPLDRGVNALIHSLRSHDIGPNGRDLSDPSGPVTTHVYAEVGHAWPQLMTSRHEEAMHFWGKLLKHIGEDRILWGTASIWYGSPTPIIAAFQCFEISPAFQARYGYPALTPARKRKILGLNAAPLGPCRGHDPPS